MRLNHFLWSFGQCHIQSNTFSARSVNLLATSNVYLSNKENQDTFARAWLDGYEIEE
ncbi:TPA: hypothetical protein ACG6RF_002083 [Streptococcus agalactiae]